MVDAHVPMLPAQPFAFAPAIVLTPAVAGDAATDAVEPSELLDVDADWLAEAFPWGMASKYLIRDRDDIYRMIFTRASVLWA